MGGNLCCAERAEGARELELSSAEADERLVELWVLLCKPSSLCRAQPGEGGCLCCRQSTSSSSGCSFGLSRVPSDEGSSHRARPRAPPCRRQPRRVRAQASSAAVTDLAAEHRGGTRVPHLAVAHPDPASTRPPRQCCVAEAETETAPVHP